MPYGVDVLHWLALHLIFSFTQMVNFPTQIPHCDSHSPALLDLFLSSDASICSTMAFFRWKILIMLLSQFLLTFHQIHNGMSHFIEELMTILVLIGMVFTNIWEMILGRISLGLVLLLVVVNVVVGSRLELLSVSLIETIRSSLTNLHGFQLLVLLP